MHKEAKMNIIYLSASCSDGKFNTLREMGMKNIIPQAQKCHRLPIECLAEHIDGENFSRDADEYISKTYFLFDGFYLRLDECVTGAVR